MSLKTILWVFFPLQILHEINCSINETRSFSKDIISPPKVIVYFSQPVIEENLTYLSHLECSTITDECKVFQESYSFYEPATALDRKTCPLHFEQQRNLTSTDVDVIPFGRDKVIIHMKHTNVYLIHMTDCNVTNIDIAEYSLVDPVAHVLPFADNKYFDFIYRDFDLCTTGRVRELYNSSGTVMHIPVCILDFAPNQTPALNNVDTDVAGISNNEYFFLDRHGDIWNGYLLKRNTNHLKVLLEGQTDYKRFPFHLISTAHKRSTVCWLPNTEKYNSVECFYAKFKEHGQKLLGLGFPYDVQMIKMHNLPNDEFLVLTSRQPHAHFTENSNMEIYDLWKFTSDTVSTNPQTTIAGLSCHKSWQRLRVTFTESGENELCISFQCKDQHKKIEVETSNDVANSFKFLTKCLTVNLKDTEKIEDSKEYDN